MKRFLTALTILLSSAYIAHAYSMLPDPNQTGSIAVSTGTQSPQQIFTSDLNATRTFIVNTSTNNIFIVGYSTIGAVNVSSWSSVSNNTTTGSFYILGTLIGPTTVQATNWTPDGPNDPYRGPLWAVAGGQGGTVIQRFRAH